MSHYSAVSRLQAFKPSSFLQIHWLQACRIAADSAAAECNSFTLIYTLKSVCLHFLTGMNDSHEEGTEGTEKSKNVYVFMIDGSLLSQRRLLGFSHAFSDQLKTEL